MDVFRRPNVDGNAEQAFRLDPQLGDIKQRGHIGDSIHQEIKIASILILTTKRRPEYARVAHAIFSR